jgi:hypothetical protein
VKTKLVFKISEKCLNKGWKENLEVTPLTTTTTTLTTTTTTQFNFV